MADIERHEAAAAGRSDVAQRANEEIREVALYGRGLRFILVDALMKQPEMSVAELVAMIGNAGFTIVGRPSKVISDALRWEVRRGRVIRLGRGRYRYNTAPPTTARRIRVLANRAHLWIKAWARNEDLPPTPPDPRATKSGGMYFPTAVPWQWLNWLWST